ncbi:hypothetical protein [Halogeometricum borinquense]|uniref:hypothetical protein n=1 Tax=Halogeometricum borinquense TaxID=60847 RepID=UPI00343DFC22
MSLTPDGLRSRAAWIPVGITAVVAAVLAIPALTDSFAGDEMVFVGAMRAAAETGRPLFYKSVQFGQQWGMWHPPTYVYSVAAAIVAFGTNTIVIRGATFVATLLTLPLLVALVNTLVDRDAVSVRESWRSPSWQLAALVLALYVLSPLTIQNGTLVDIDGSLLPISVTAFILYAIRTFERDGPIPKSRYIGLTILFAGVSWVKFGPLPVLVVSFVGYLVLRGQYRRLLPAVAALVVGFGLFSATWWGVSSALDLPFWRPYEHNFGMLLSGGDGREIALQTRLMLSGWAGYASLLWLSPFLILLAVGSLPSNQETARPTLEWLRNRAPVLFVGAVAVLTYVQYTVLAKLPYGFPKYMGISTPLFAVLAAVCVAHFLNAPLENRRLWCFGAVLAGVVAAVTFLAPDPFYVSFNKGTMPVLLRAGGTVLAYIVGFASVYALFDHVETGVELNRSSLAAVTLVVLLVGTNGGLILTQATAGYSTHYDYGQKGNDEVLSYVQEMYVDLPADEQSEVVVPFDIGLKLREPYHDTELYSVSDLEDSQPPLVVVKHRKYYAVNSALLDRLNDHSDYSKRTVGSFSIFIREDVSTE